METKRIGGKKMSDNDFFLKRNRLGLFFIIFFALFMSALLLSASIMLWNQFKPPKPVEKETTVEETTEDVQIDQQANLEQQSSETQQTVAESSESQEQQSQVKKEKDNKIKNFIFIVLLFLTSISIIPMYFKMKWGCVIFIILNTILLLWFIPPAFVNKSLLAVLGIYANVTAYILVATKWEIMN